LRPQYGNGGGSGLVDSGRAVIQPSISQPNISRKPSYMESYDHNVYGAGAGSPGRGKYMPATGAYNPYKIVGRHDHNPGTL